MKGKGYPNVSALDLLSCLVMVFAILALVSTPEQRKPAVETLGYIAVVTRWEDGSFNDVDTYLRNPDGDIAYFASPDLGWMHLEQDDLGTDVSGAVQNGERIIIRKVIPGEYIANVHMYGGDKETVTVELWRLRGNDERVLVKTIKLRWVGDEATAFRFTLDAQGNIKSTSDLEYSMVDDAAAQPPPMNAPPASQVPPGWGGPGMPGGIG